MSAPERRGTNGRRQQVDGWTLNWDESALAFMLRCLAPGAFDNRPRWLRAAHWHGPRDTAVFMRLGLASAEVWRNALLARRGVRKFTTSREVCEHAVAVAIVEGERISRRRHDKKRTAPLVFEVFAETAGPRNRTLHDHSMIGFVPLRMTPVFPEGNGWLTMSGPRRDALLVRARILKAHPGADVRIFELPEPLMDAWSGAFECDFVNSPDGLTLVAPSGTTIPASAKGPQWKRQRATFTKGGSS